MLSRSSTSGVRTVNMVKLGGAGGALRVMRELRVVSGSWVRVVEEVRFGRGLG
jgi:hypothetical protein